MVTSTPIIPTQHCTHPASYSLTETYFGVCMHPASYFLTVRDKPGGCNGKSEL